MARYLKVLGKVQDLLGECNDAQVALRLLDSLTPPERLNHFARRWVVARLPARIAAVDRHFAELQKMVRFWQE